MSIYKECADNLRSRYRELTGEKLGSGYSHELVAAYFSYGNSAALRAEQAYPLSNLWQADVLIPNLLLMDERVQNLSNLPENLPSVDDLADWLAEFLIGAGHFSGMVWHTRDLSDYINTDYIQKDPMMIENDLSGEIASTNAYFDELYIYEVEIERCEGALVAHVVGDLNGETDQDRVFHGDKIKFTTLMTFDRVAGRNAYSLPRLETSGAVDQSFYEDNDA
ncbi:hypothetical protein [Rhizorhabdus sp. FW153]|uniref:hypothetical protein n=1 Tax=Rhizorhabdus sp. FW153 TaxID=3400216 RepID=UPI003CFB2669